LTRKLFFRTIPEMMDAHLLGCIGSLSYGQMGLNRSPKPWWAAMSERGATYLQPSGRSAASLCGVIKCLQSPAHRSAFEGLERGASNV
jgi:hypothetical protein